MELWRTKGVNFCTCPICATSIAPRRLRQELRKQWRTMGFKEEPCKHSGGLLESGSIFARSHSPRASRRGFEKLSNYAYHSVFYLRVGKSKTFSV